MPQFKHDRFVKFYLKELYNRIKGRVASNIEVTAHETLSIDLLYHAQKLLPAWQEQNLGLLDLIMADRSIAIVEHYSHYFEKDNFKNCQVRNILYELQNKETLEKQEPFTWVITARFSKNMSEICSPIPDSTWRKQLNLDLVKPKQGSDPNDLRLREPIVRFPDIFNLGIVIIERLPLTPETMWLKLLGEETDCKAAYRAIKNSPASRTRSATLKACAKFNSYIKSLPKEEITEEDMILVRSTEEVDRLYAEDYDDILAKGRAEAVKSFLVRKFGDELPIEEIAVRLGQLSSVQLDDLLFQAAGWDRPIQLQDYLESFDSFS